MVFGLAGKTQQNEVEKPAAQSWSTCSSRVCDPLGFYAASGDDSGRSWAERLLPGKGRRAGFGRHMRDERAEKREKHRYVLLVYRRVHGKEAWQLLPEHGEALDGFEEHLEVSLRVFPCPLAVSLIDANMKRFMWVSSSARAGKSLITTVDTINREEY